ncbi:MAG TPA: nucleoside-diphosphate sugar epimerase/dehydratase [Bryobacteraceae bacterium]|nr:nucleoside-diphosphate sugar epimerase/dehydratase [Bryobacteraceae bacterium]
MQASIFPRALLLAIVAKLLAFDGVGFYRSLRRFVSIPDLYPIIMGNAAGTALFAAAALIWIGPAMPASVIVIDGIICFAATTLVRFSVRIRHELFRKHSRQARTGILIYGAGAAGAELVHEIHSNRCTRYAVRGLLDDDPLKRGAIILGVPVLGTGREALSIVERLNSRGPVVDEIIIAMRSATGPQMREALANCRAARIPCKTVPGIDELLSRNVLAAQVRDLSLQDLLGRQTVKLDDSPVRARIRGRSVLITGAAGSIGSELCRQVARFSPSRLVALDQSESELFRIDNELREKFPNLEVVAALGDIRDTCRLPEIMERHRVESVFHAAAYKHVPMMESHVVEAARNNIIGTWNLVQAARAAGVRNLLMISSDKAVNPVCVMGATKRVCERIVGARHRNGRTVCASVRFGNVLGSNGSVVPIFQSQIAAGGPVKVTHPEARRYFMTISEAVALTLQASAKSQGSEIFVLDMGEPVRILDLAEDMIRLAGLIPYEDIEIQFTGLRPGEKLMEEINGESEGLMPTDQEKMRVIREAPLDWSVIPAWIEGLEELLARRSQPEILAHIRQLVPEYCPLTRPAPEDRLPLAQPVTAQPSLCAQYGNGGEPQESILPNSPGAPVICEP